ncbi:MAG: DUF2569 domain-containing protein [Gammaproteobacteria bacterium]
MVNDTELKGLGGWLTLPALGLLATPVIICYGLATDFWPIFAKGYWAILTTPRSSAYNPLWAPLLSFEIAGNILILLAALVLLYLFFTKSFRLPKLMVTFLLANLLFVTADYFLTGNIATIPQHARDEAMTQILRSLLASIIWVPYFLVSKRVKNTFVSNEIAASSRAMQ